jgi:DNA-binding CsgD family transcriptional regulator
LPGRRHECEHLRRLLAEASSSIATGLLLTGEAGIGKTALLDWVAEEAADFRVLRTVGTSIELGVPHAALYDLLVPILGFRDSLPTVQSAAIAGALALEATAGSPLAVGAATLGLVAAAAENQPLLILVDDLQWIDPASQAALAFAVRRLGAESVAVVLAARTNSEALRLFDWMPSVQIAGLDAAAAEQLFASAGKSVPPDTARRLVMATGGNPLALQHAVTVVDELDSIELSVRPAPIEPMLERVLRRRLDAVPPACRQALLLLAVEPDDPAVVTRALVLAGLGPEALLPAEDAGLVTFDGGQPTTTHPLVYSAVYHSASAPERRTAHRAASEALDGLTGPLQVERRALHLALAASGADPALASELDKAATTSLRGGRLAAASDLFERAGQLSLDPQQRWACTVQAAELAFPVGQVQRAAKLLDQVAVQIPPESSLHLRCRHLLSRVAMWQGRPAEAYRLLAQPGTLRGPDMATISFMLSDAGVSALMLGDRDTAARCARDAGAISAGLPEEQAVPAWVLNAMLEVVGGDIAAARTLLVRCAELLQGQDARVSGQWTLIAALAYFGLDDLDTADSYFAWIVDQARRLCAPGLLPFPLSWHAKLAFRNGDWALAAAWAQEAVDLARATQSEIDSAPGLALLDSLATLALVEAGLGRDDDCREHSGEVLADRTAGAWRPVDAHAHLALGILEVGDANYEAAYEHLKIVRDFCGQASFGEGPLLSWAADFAEVAGRTGDSAAAAEAVAVLENEAARANRRTDRAGLARCSALAEGVSVQHSEDQFRQAVDLYAEAGSPFEQARAELYWGERLRRSARPGEARGHLTTARQMFASLGAQRWTARADAELRAAGGRVKRTETARDDLTPQELRVALMVAQGLSNVEAANRLFLSPKTIEFHLGNAFRKLGVPNRAALASAMAGRRP